MKGINIIITIVVYCAVIVLVCNSEFSAESLLGSSNDAGHHVPAFTDVHTSIEAPAIIDGDDDGRMSKRSAADGDDDDNSSIWGTINKWGFGALGKINVIFSFVNFIISRVNEGNSFSTKKAFEKLESRLASLEQSLTSLIKEEGMKRAFFEREAQIKTSLRHASAYLYTNKTEIARQDFISVASGLENSISILYDGLTNGLLFGWDVLSITRHNLKCHTKKFLDASTNYLDLLRIGTIALGIYFEARNYTKTNIDFWIDTLAELEGTAKRRVDTFALGCANDEGNVVQDMKDIMKNESMNGDGTAVADALYEFLSEKYLTKEWYVVVYEDIGNYPSLQKVDPAFHFVSDGLGVGLNAFAKSFDKNCSIFNANMSAVHHNYLIRNVTAKFCSAQTYLLHHKSRYVWNVFNPFQFMTGQGFERQHTACETFRADYIHEQLTEALRNFEKDVYLAVLIVRNEIGALIRKSPSFYNDFNLMRTFTHHGVWDHWFAIVSLTC